MAIVTVKTLSGDIKNSAPVQYKQLLRNMTKFKQFTDLNIVEQEKCFNFNDGKINVQDNDDFYAQFTHLIYQTLCQTG